MVLKSVAVSSWCAPSGDEGDSTQDNAQQLVEVVGNSIGQLPQNRQPLATRNEPLLALLRRHIAEHQDDLTGFGRPGCEINRGHREHTLARL